MTTECERFEIEIGMAQHGALDALEQSALETHLATCASCRQFASASGGVDAALRRQAEREIAAVDWNAIRLGVRRLQRSYRRKLWLAPLFLFQVPLIFLLGLGHLPPPELLASAPATVAIYAAYVWLINRPFREVMAVVKGGDELLLGYARELRRQVLRTRVFVVLNLMLTIACLLGALLLASPRLRLFELGAALFFAAWAASDLRWKLPRLRRALAEAAR